MNWQQMHAAATIALLRTLLIGINTIFLVTGAILFLLAIIISDQFSNIHTIVPQMHAAAPYIIISLGVFIFFLGLFALWCTIRGQLTFLSIYACILALIFLFEIALAIGYLTRRQAFESSFKGAAKSIMNFYPSQGLPKKFSHLQSALGCCGVDSYRDWFETSYGNKSMEVPQSCCKVYWDVNCNRTNLRGENDLKEIYSIGCYPTLLGLIKQHYPVFGGFFIAAALVPLLGSILTCVLIFQMGKHRYEKVNQS